MSTISLTALSEEMYVAGQIQADDVPALKAQGFVSIICNRPDGESPDQPTAHEIQHAAEAIGIAFSYVPFAPAQPSPTLVPDFAQVLKDHPGKTLAYCRSGMRSSRLFQAVHPT
jgi:sulfide:quinone oxidoreductase